MQKRRLVRRSALQNIATVYQDSIPKAGKINVRSKITKVQKMIKARILVRES